MAKGYSPAQEVEELIKEKNLLTEEISDAKIKYLFNLNENWNKGGQCSLASGKWKFLTDFDYVIVINHHTWNTIDDKQKSALIEHELTHICSITVEKTGEKKWKLRDHDTEEFVDIVKKYGAWTPALTEFKEALQ